jgi:sulfate permease, SulP family
MSDAAPESLSAPPPRHRRHWRPILRYKGRNFIRRISLNWFPGARLFRRTPRPTLVADARAGANVALLAFPQCIAYALIAGLPAQVGLIAAGVGAIVGPLFSGTRFLIIGPTNATAIMIFAGLTSAGLSDEQKVVALPLLVLLVGLFLLIGALARASLLINYISARW